MKCVLPVAVAVAAALQSFVPSTAAAATVTATPSGDLSALVVGDAFTVTLGAGDDFDPFFGGAIAVTYDADILSLTGGAAINPPFSFSMVGAEPAGASGTTTVTAMFSAFADQPPGTGFLDLTFEAAGVGVSMLAFSEATVGLMTGFINAASQKLSDVAFESLTATVTGDTIAPIPLPAAGWMLLAGLGALGMARRRS